MVTSLLLLVLYLVRVENSTRVVCFTHAREGSLEIKSVIVVRSTWGRYTHPRSQYVCESATFPRATYDRCMNVHYNRTVTVA